MLSSRFTILRRLTTAQTPKTSLHSIPQDFNQTLESKGYDLQKIIRDILQQSNHCYPNFRELHINEFVSLDKPTNHEAFILPPLTDDDFVSLLQLIPELQIDLLLSCDQSGAFAVSKMHLLDEKTSKELLMRLGDEKLLLLYKQDSHHTKWFFQLKTSDNIENFFALIGLDNLTHACRDKKQFIHFVKELNKEQDPVLRSSYQLGLLNCLGSDLLRGYVKSAEDAQSILMILTDKNECAFLTLLGEQKIRSIIHNQSQNNLILHQLHTPEARAKLFDSNALPSIKTDTRGRNYRRLDFIEGDSVAISYSEPTETNRPRLG